MALSEMQHYAPSARIHIQNRFNAEVINQSRKVTESVIMLGIALEMKAVVVMRGSFVIVALQVLFFIHGET
jgi:hypothetical protein